MRFHVLVTTYEQHKAAITLECSCICNKHTRSKAGIMLECLIDGLGEPLACVQ